MQMSASSTSPARPLPIGQRTHTPPDLKKSVAHTAIDIYYIIWKKEGGKREEGRRREIGREEQREGKREGGKEGVTEEKRRRI